MLLFCRHKRCVRVRLQSMGCVLRTITPCVLIRCTFRDFSHCTPLALIKLFLFRYSAICERKHRSPSTSCSLGAQALLCLIKGCPKSNGVWEDENSRHTTYSQYIGYISAEEEISKLVHFPIGFIFFRSSPCSDRASQFRRTK